MAGGPSQLDLFEPQAGTEEAPRPADPDSFIAGKRFAFMDTFSKEKPKLLASPRKFAQHGKSGAWVSECLPETAKIVDDLTFIRSMAIFAVSGRHSETHAPDFPCWANFRGEAGASASPC